MDAPLWDDGRLAVCNKPHGEMVHDPRGRPAPYLARLGEALGRPGAPAVLHPCHRLDAATGGALLLARDAQAAQAASGMFAGRRVEKRYLALCAGEPSPGGALTVEAPLGQQGRRAVVAGGGGREARTRAWTVAVGRDASLWVVAPEGGRFHQVRAHLASAGHPLVGDWRYGQPADLCLGLHALGLRFTHPFTGAPVLVVAPPQPLFQRLANRHGLPPDWQERALDALRWETPS